MELLWLHTIGKMKYTLGKFMFSRKQIDKCGSLIRYKVIPVQISLSGKDSRCHITTALNDPNSYRYLILAKCFTSYRLILRIKL